MQQKIHDGAVITEKSTLIYDHWIKLTKFSLEKVIYKPLKTKKNTRLMALCSRLTG